MEQNEMKHQVNHKHWLSSPCSLSLSKLLLTGGGKNHHLVSFRQAESCFIGFWIWNWRVLLKSKMLMWEDKLPARGLRGDQGQFLNLRSGWLPCLCVLKPDGLGPMSLSCTFFCSWSHTRPEAARDAGPAQGEVNSSPSAPTSQNNQVSITRLSEDKRIELDQFAGAISTAGPWHLSTLQEPAIFPVKTCQLGCIYFP